MIHVPPPNKLDRLQVLKHCLNDAHDISDEEFDILGRISYGLSSSDVSAATNAAINLHHQRAIVAKKFKEIKTPHGIQHEPIVEQEELHSGDLQIRNNYKVKLYPKKVSFHDMVSVMRLTRPSSELHELDLMKDFEMRHPNLTILDIDCESNHYFTSKLTTKEEKRTKKKKKNIFHISCVK